MIRNPFGARAILEGSRAPVYYYRLNALEEAGLGAVSRLPYSIKVLLEALLRQVDGFAVSEADVAHLAAWDAANVAPVELPFKPARVILQDFTGVPAILDLAAMRSAMARAGGDPRRVNPLIPVDLVIDHSVQVDEFGSRAAFLYNAEREFERNRERYEFLKWGQEAFTNFRVVPPATGIVHQVNLEYLASVVQQRRENGDLVAFPDSLVGTDSHTTMVNGLGVLGWGVGGIEAEAAMLGQPIYMLAPQVVGLKLTGALPEGSTATDLVLTIAQMLRAHGVVDKFVEFYGPGLSRLTLPDRATIGNMAPEYGATIAFFPVDAETLRYLALSGRSEELVDLVERYCKAQGLFHTADSPDPVFSDTLELDMSTVQPSMAGPRRPQDRVSLAGVGEGFRKAFPKEAARITGAATRSASAAAGDLEDGAVVIAAITSCTNTSNPSVMVGAGLVAKKAAERGMKPRPWVKTSLAPGSQVVTRYLDEAGLTPYLEQMGFYTVGYGCTTCIGNSGPLPHEVADAVMDKGLAVAAVLSGNRNFEGRIHPLVRANYLASPPLVVAYALAGTLDIDLTQDPLGADAEGNPVYLRDLWPTQEEVRETIAASLRPEMFRQQYANVFSGNETWNKVKVTEGDYYAWNPASTYIQEPPFFVGLELEPAPRADIRAARVLAYFGDSVTTDHISPAGSIATNSPAGRYLLENGVSEIDFNSYGARRGNHNVLVRGTFANIRIRNKLVPGVEGGYTRYLPTGEQMSIYDAAMRYIADGTPTIVLAGKEYGTGSSRDWAAKGPLLQGVSAVLAESFERIHRSNLVGMGILPLQFMPGQSAESLGLTGEETFDIAGLEGEMQPKQRLVVTATAADGTARTFEAISRIDTPVEVHYYANGGILQTVLRQMMKE
ncbi:MAG: Aconitate hydratase [Chloroflexi bacterium ADurb.Bin325]|nr:MAG: Aconitate hydratase [Chloroflexi bacterium ADurb.Bin325]